MQSLFPCSVIVQFLGGYQSSLSGKLAVLHGRNFNMGCYAQSFQPKFFIPAKLLGTICFYHFVLLSVTLTLAGVTRSVQSKTFQLHFLAHCSTEKDEI